MLKFAEDEGAAGRKRDGDDDDPPAFAQDASVMRISEWVN